MKEVTDPGDADIARFAAILRANFADRNLWLSEQRIREFLADSPSDARSFHLVIAAAEDQVLGGTLFSCSATTGAGFSEYIVLHKDARGQGVSRKLIDLRHEVLDRSARSRGFPASPGVFIEVENPFRMPAAFLEKERAVAMDATERWRYFHHMGFMRTNCIYRMPSLGPDHQPIDYLDLMFCPWSEEYTDALPADFLLESIGPTWLAWSPEQGARALDRLRQTLGGQPVRLISLDTEFDTLQRR